MQWELQPEGQAKSHECLDPKSAAIQRQLYRRVLTCRRIIQSVGLTGDYAGDNVLAIQRSSECLVVNFMGQGCLLEWKRRSHLYRAFKFPTMCLLDVAYILQEQPQTYPQIPIHSKEVNVIQQSPEPDRKRKRIVTLKANFDTWASRDAPNPPETSCAVLEVMHIMLSLTL